MKATGIVRRIDDLGRVVIPKEIRRTMRIREGDPLEIYTDTDGEVIFKKYSPIGELGPYTKQYVDVLGRTTGMPVVLPCRVCLKKTSQASAYHHFLRAIWSDAAPIFQVRTKIPLSSPKTHLKLSALCHLLSVVAMLWAQLCSYQAKKQRHLHRRISSSLR